MKRLMQTVALVFSCTLLLSGCGASSESSEPVARMIDTLYFGKGSYETYQSAFQNPSKVISQEEFDKIRSQGPKTLFAEQTYEEVEKHLRAFLKDEETGVVYWTDFKEDKSKDIHWDIIKTDDGWKIKN